MDKKIINLEDIDLRAEMKGFTLDILCNKGVLKCSGQGDIRALKRVFLTLFNEANNLEIPDKKFYTPKFTPWISPRYKNFGDYFNPTTSYTLVSADRQYTLFTLAQQAGTIKGEWVECGVYKGGTAILLAKIINDNNFNTSLHLFDTFEGTPDTNPNIDIIKKGTFSDCSLQEVKERIQAVCNKNVVSYHPGFIPDTFDECSIDEIAFAHVDVDIFKSVLDCCEFIYPKLVSGGFLVFDDYGFPDCPGAKKAVDQYFSDKVEIPLILSTGQAIVIKY